MESKLTFGPFFAHDDTHINKEGKIVGAVRITDTPGTCGKWIAEVYPYGATVGNFPEHEEAIQLATLFAAAPDLFDATEYAIERLESIGNLGDAGDQALTALKSAYLKATGQPITCENQ